MTKEISKKELDDLLTKLPFKIFLLIADADGKIDLSEYTKFAEMMNKKDACKNGYARNVFSKASLAYSSLKMAYGMGNIKKDMEQVVSILDVIYERLPYKDCKELTEDMERLSVSIAESSGDSGGFFSKKKSTVSAAEKEVMDQLHQLFKEHLQKAKDYKNSMGLLSEEEAKM